MKPKLKDLMSVINEVKKETKTGLQPSALFSFIPDSILNH